MVFFTCNACGESVKKGQVEKHVNICKNCQYLSCIDCGKDFWGDEYKKHVKCISEDQKYGGKGYEVKTSKGDVKQQEWIQKIHEVMKKPSISPKLREILEKVSGFDNIPRKKAKFQNWMKNSLKIYNDSLQEQVWDIFSEATRNGPNTKEQEKQPLNQVENQHSENKVEVEAAPPEGGEKPAGQPQGKKNKREHKEERQKSHKKEKKELKLENHQENSSDPKSKKRKRAMAEGDAEREEKPEISNAEKRKNKKKKAKKERAPEAEVNGDGSQDGERTAEETPRAPEKRKRKHSEEEADSKKKKMRPAEEASVGTEEAEVPGRGKFNWKGTIKAVLKQAPDNELSVKKLRKKVLAQYYAVTSDHHKSEEELLVIFNKKISKNPTFRLLKEKVKLLK